MAIRIFLTYAILFGLLLSGCQGTGEVINLTPKPLTVSSKQKKGLPDKSLSIGVETFKDAREQKKRIGIRTHFWGGITNFNAWNGEIGDGMAKLAVAYLKQDKWNVKRLKSGAGPNSTKPDVTLTGQVLTLKTRAKSGFGFTQIDVNLKVLFEVENAKDGSTVRLVLGSNGTDSVVFFDPRDVEMLTSQVAKELYLQLFRDLTVKNGGLRLRS